MIVSLNEIEVNLRKAAIGAGLPLGLAEDLGRAATWLAVFELPAVAICLGALEHLRAGTAGEARLEENEAGSWVLRSNAVAQLSSLYAGPAAADLLLVAASEGTLPVRLWLDATDRPLLALAAVCDLLVRRGDVVLECACVLTGGEVPLAFHEQGRVTFSQDPARLPSPCSISLTLSMARGERAETQGQDFFACQERIADRGVAVDVSDWQRIQQLVAETLVPASELSRLQGAGAGLSDND